MLAEYRHLPLPRGWSDRTVSDVAEVVGGSTPDTTEPSYWNGEIPWATPTDITALSTRHIHDTASKITQAGLNNSGAKLLPPGSILMTSRATIGACGINTVPMATNQGFASLVCKNGTDAEFIYYLMTARAHELSRWAAGSTFIELGKNDFRRVRVMLPPHGEQMRIAEVLVSIDTAIERARAVIEWVRVVKKALLADLMTNGLPGRHKRFKTVKRIGRIPADWEVVRLDEVAIQITDGEHLTPERSSSGIYLLSARNVHDGYLALDDVDFIGEAEYVRLSKRCQPQTDDILISCSGTIGRICRVPPGLRCAMVRSVAIVKPIRDRCFPPYLEWCLRSFALQKQMQVATNQAAQGNLFQEPTRRLRLALPEMSEQRRIAAAFEGIKKRDDTEVTVLQQLLKLKSALGDALLTGRIRVVKEGRK